MSDVTTGNSAKVPAHVYRDVLTVSSLLPAESLVQTAMSQPDPKMPSVQWEAYPDDSSSGVTYSTRKTLTVDAQGGEGIFLHFTPDHLTAWTRAGSPTQQFIDNLRSHSSGSRGGSLLSIAPRASIDSVAGALEDFHRRYLDNESSHEPPPPVRFRDRRYIQTDFHDSEGFTIEQSLHDPTLICVVFRDTRSTLQSVAHYLAPLPSTAAAWITERLPRAGQQYSKTGNTMTDVEQGKTGFQEGAEWGDR